MSRLRRSAMCFFSRRCVIFRQLVTAPRQRQLEKWHFHYYSRRQCDACIIVCSMCKVHNMSKYDKMFDRLYIVWQSPATNGQECIAHYQTAYTKVHNGATFDYPTASRLHPMHTCTQVLSAREMQSPELQQDTTHTHTHERQRDYVSRRARANRLHRHYVDSVRRRRRRDCRASRARTHFPTCARTLVGARTCVHITTLGGLAFPKCTAALYDPACRSPAGSVGHSARHSRRS